MTKSLDLDVRRGLPSASAMYRYRECSGALALTNLLRQEGKLVDFPNGSANAGIRIHEWLAFEALNQIAIPVTLSADDLATAQMCAQLRNERVGQWRQGEFETIVEKRFWYREGVWPRFSAQPDFIAIDSANKRALVANYKTGRLESEDAADNVQLRAEIVALWHNFPELEEIAGTIIEPWVTWENVAVSYTHGHLRIAEIELLQIVNRTKFERERRTAGPWCTKCPAQIHCHEAIAYVEQLPALKPEQAIYELPRGERGVQFWERIKVAEKLIETLKKAYVVILENEPTALPGYILPAQGRERRYVPYPAKLKTALADYLTAEEIDGCASYHLGKIEELLGLKRKLEGKELEKLFKSLTNGAVSTTHDAPFIRPMTRKEREAAVIVNELTQGECS
jgi:hypothetical protein